MHQGVKDFSKKANSNPKSWRFTFCRCKNRICTIILTNKNMKIRLLTSSRDLCKFCLFTERYKSKFALTFALFLHYLFRYFQIFERVYVQKNFYFFSYYSACLDFSLFLNFCAIYDVYSGNCMPNTLVLVY